MTEERWKPIPGYEGSYEVSDLGRVRSLDRRMPNRRWPSTQHTRLVRGGVLKPTERSDGYLSVGLCGKSRLVHRLVLSAFAGPCPTGQQTRHLNGCRADNRAANLCWGTPGENTSDRFAHGTVPQGECVAASRLTADEVRVIVKRIQSGHGQQRIADDYGVSLAEINNIARGKVWKSVTGGPVKGRNRHLFFCEAASAYALIRGGVPNREVAARTGVSLSKVQAIAVGAAWVGLTGGAVSGRAQGKGEDNPMARLTEGQVREIAQRLKRREPQAQIAESFGVTRGLIGHIARGKIWAHVTGGEVSGRFQGPRKLDATAVKEAVRRCEAGETRSAVARDFGVTPALISQVMNGRAWSHVTGIKPKQKQSA
jgi:uncharacterized protein (DUF433 family)